MKIMSSLNLMIFFTCCMVDAVMFATHKEPSSILPGYHNNIIDISYNIDQDNGRAMVIALEEDPICIYAPLSYQDYLNASVVKTYFLPRTHITEAQMQYLANDMRKELGLLDIDLQVSQVQGRHYGVELTFLMNSINRYSIEKNIDRNHKMIRFLILEQK